MRKGLRVLARELDQDPVRLSTLLGSAYSPRCRRSEGLRSAEGQFLENIQMAKEVVLDTGPAVGILVLRMG